MILVGLVAALVATTPASAAQIVAEEPLDGGGIELTIETPAFTRRRASRSSCPRAMTRIRRAAGR